MDRTLFKKLIDTAAGRIPADTVIRGGMIADVYSGRFFQGDLSIAGGLIAGLDAPGASEGREVIDARGLYVLPGFMDSHIHIESSFLSPRELGKLLVPRGTTTIITDPHEIVNVCGLAGLDYMIRASEDTALDIRFMVPSCVPSAPFEHGGAVLEAESLREPLGREKVLGLGEMMNYPGVVNAEPGVMDKILLAFSVGRIIDGHSPGLAGKELNAYAAASIRTDHECSDPEEMRARLSRGMYVMLRQGSACPDLRNLIPGITAENSRRCLLCSDDLQPKTIFEEGHIDNDLRICVEEGIDPMTALRMATLNGAECFRLGDRGGLAPGLRADIVLADNLRDFRAKKVLIRGLTAAEDGVYLGPSPASGAGDDRAVRGSFHVKDFSVKRLSLALASDEVYVIDVRGGSVNTGKGKARVKRSPSGEFVFDPGVNAAKIAVVERHKNTGHVGLGLIRGYGIQRGAAAISVSHDSHNIITVGTNDADMAAAVERLIAISGGAVLVLDGKVLEEMPLPLGGVMADGDGRWVEGKLVSLHDKAVRTLGVSPSVEPFMTLCFMSLPAIPELKITDQGLFDVQAQRFIRPEVS
jgi:adenine deaminase